MSVPLLFDTLLEASFRALVIAGFVAAALRIFQIRVAAVTHVAWTMVMLTMLVLPVVSGWLPTVPVWMPQQRERPIATPTTITDQATIAAGPLAPRSTVQRMVASQQPAPTSTAVGTLAVKSRTPETFERRDWRAIAIFVWLAVSGLLLLRQLTGWWRVSRLSAAGVPSSMGDGTFTSGRVMTPVVTGVIQPRVMVPESWEEWGTDVRRMVLAHERAHLRRRDPLVAMLARVNRAVFWFHPLAWWMERHLSRLAERACDDSAVRIVKDARLYAALLVEMAHRLRHHGHRVAWQGIGIVSSRRFEDRLDQILAGPEPGLSRGRKTALMVVCGLLVTVGVACGTAAAPLTEDPELAKNLAASAARFDEYQSAQTITLEQVAELEQAVAKNPDDLSATSKLLIFYMSRGQKLMGWNEMVVARRPHLLRMIERHPESSMSRWPFSRRLDPEGFDKAKAAWLVQTARADASPAVLSQAASFFERSDKPLAEQLLLRGQAADPKGPTPRVSIENEYRMPWSRRLGALYAMTIAGSDGLSVWDKVTTANVGQTQSAFAKQVRQKLDESNDPVMLLAASSFLTNYAAEAKVGFDLVALGREYEARAVKLDPTSEAARRIMSRSSDAQQRAAHNAEWERIIKVYGRPVHTMDDASFEQLPMATKLEHARDFLWAPYGRVMAAYPKKDQQAVESAFASLKNRAETIQRVVDSADASAKPASLQAELHIAFGTYAIHQGDRREAVRRLALAGSSGSLAIETIGFLQPAADKLAYDLLGAGERESVATFYDAASKSFEGESRTRYEQAAKAIREGRMPSDYQRSLARWR